MQNRTIHSASGTVSSVRHEVRRGELEFDLELILPEIIGIGKMSMRDRDV